MEDAFAPGTPEVEIEQHKTVLLGEGRPKMGRAILTNERIMFVDTKFDTGVAAASGGLIGGAIAARLQKKHEERGPVLDLPLVEIERVSQAKKLMNKDIIVLESRSGVYRLNDGFKKLDSLLRRLMTERHGRIVTEDGAGAWRVDG